jgi:hypothetical protein
MFLLIILLWQKYPIAISHLHIKYIRAFLMIRVESFGVEKLEQSKAYCCEESHTVEKHEVSNLFKEIIDKDCSKQ